MASSFRFVRSALALFTAVLLTSACALHADPPEESEGSEDVKPCGKGDTAAKGQERIRQGRYEQAVHIFSCVVDNNPTELAGYRGRAEAELLLGRYSDAMADYASVNAFVLPAHADAIDAIFAGYDERLAADPDDRAALTGASFAHWWFFDYVGAGPLLDQLVAEHPSDEYGTLFRGSNRLFVGEDVSGGLADFETALALGPSSADVRFIVADGYTYAYPDAERALAEASLALEWGLNTPRIHAILARAQFALGDVGAGSAHILEHINLVTTETVETSALESGEAATLDLVPGRTYEVPLSMAAGELLAIRTTSPTDEVYDSIAVLLDSDGVPVIGNDDFIDYFAGFDWVATEAGVYALRVTSFEGVSTGQLAVIRD